MTTNTADRRFMATDLARFIAAAYSAAGVPAADADTAARLMVEADLVGADAHGIFRLAQYIDRIASGGLNKRANITVTRTAPATARVDGDNGLGALVVAKAAETAIAIARETGVAWVGVHGSNHAGAASVYAALPMAAPGDDRALRHRDRTANGVPLSPQVQAKLAAMATRLGIKAL